MCVDDGAAEADIVLIEHRELSRSEALIGLVKDDQRAAVFTKGGGGMIVRLAVSDFDATGKWFTDLWGEVGNPVELGHKHLVSDARHSIVVA